MSIHQISVSYEEAQDRLLVRMNTLDKQEYRLWFTRRLTYRLLPYLEHELHQQEIKQSGIDGSSSAVREFAARIQRELNLDKADFGSAFETQSNSLPLGEVPLLVTHTKITPMADSSTQLQLEENPYSSNSPRRLQVTLSLTMMQGLVHLMHSSLCHTDWAFIPLGLQHLGDQYSASESTVQAPSQSAKLLH